MQYIWRYLRKHPKLLFLDFLGAFFFVLVNLGLPTILARMVDEAILPHDVSRVTKLEIPICSYSWWENCWILS